MISVENMMMGHILLVVQLYALQIQEQTLVKLCWLEYLGIL
jgi:hypothetical protein